MRWCREASKIRNIKSKGSQESANVSVYGSFSLNDKRTTVKDHRQFMALTLSCCCCCCWLAQNLQFMKLLLLLQHLRCTWSLSKLDILSVCYQKETTIFPSQSSGRPWQQPQHIHTWRCFLLLYFFRFMAENSREIFKLLFAYVEKAAAIIIFSICGFLLHSAMTELWTRKFQHIRVKHFCNEFFQNCSQLWKSHYGNIQLT